ncbi:hypothetical protein CSUI_008194, partial [Cystoisospora suis]
PLFSFFFCRKGKVVVFSSSFCCQKEGCVKTAERSLRSE